MTPLHMAAWGNHKEIAVALLQAGAIVNAKTNDGETPLLMASQYGNADVVGGGSCAGAVAVVFFFIFSKRPTVCHSHIPHTHTHTTTTPLPRQEYCLNMAAIRQRATRRGCARWIWPPSTGG